jgi:uncharacterized protein
VRHGKIGSGHLSSGDARVEPAHDELPITRYKTALLILAHDHRPRHHHDSRAFSPALEGGYYAETYRSAFGTAIYYLLTADSFSAMHRLPGDEIFHFYLGDPVEMLQLRPDGTGEVLILGPDLLRGMRLQTVVAGGVWQGARLAAGRSFALMGTTMAPGFDFADYVARDAAQLSAAYPQHAERIKELTRT